MRYLFGLLLLIPFLISGVSYEHLTQILDEGIEQQPFDYNLGIRILPGKSKDSPVMLCFHGYGSSNHLIDTLRTYPEIEDHLVSFNFPDYNLRPNARDPESTSFGSIQELLGAFYILKKLVIEGNIGRIDLYGFSAGGGALVNTIAILNSSKFSKELEAAGINPEGRKKILNAILNGYVILDTPLKSMGEIIAFRGRTKEFDILEKRYQQNEMVPIDALSGLDKLPLNIIVHFQANDEALSNRDDSLYVSLVRKYNKNGRTCVVFGNDGGHLSYHRSLWSMYPEFTSGRCGECCIVEYGK